MVFNLSVIGEAIRMSSPILLAGTGTLYNDRAGVTNITIEGTMLLSGFFAVACSYFTSNWIVGALAGVTTGILISVVFFLLTAWLGGDELVVGFSMNILLDGFSVFLLRQIFHKSGSLVDPRIQGIPTISANLLRKIPVIGTMFTPQTWIVYFAFALAVFTWFIFNRTPFGLRIVACGENAEAAATVGINVARNRFWCNVIGGALSGLAGVQISLGYLSLFTRGMTVGRGFIALGSVIFSRGNPLRLIAVSLLFGFSEALSNKMQLLQLPSELVLILPYLAVVVLTLIRFDRYKKMLTSRGTSNQVGAS